MIVSIIKLYSVCYEVINSTEKDACFEQVVKDRRKKEERKTGVRKTKRERRKLGRRKNKWSFKREGRCVWRSISQQPYQSDGLNLFFCWLHTFSSSQTISKFQVRADVCCRALISPGLERERGSVTTLYFPEMSARARIQERRRGRREKELAGEGSPLSCRSLRGGGGKPVVSMHYALECVLDWQPRCRPRLEQSRH